MNERQAMEPVHLSIKGVSKSFGKVKALNEVSLDVMRGSFTTFLGPSGCGKTTLLRTIAGFYNTEKGSIVLAGRRIDEVPSHLRGAIMVFQDYALFPHMNVRENISYGLKIKKLAPKEIEGRVARTVSYLGIEGLLERTPGQVSGGQQQRVALARALVMEPELLLLDEPLSNLDAKLRVNIRAELRLLQQRLKITTIYVTHDQAEALALSDQIAVMNEGRIVQAGSPGEVYYRPRSAFVASFVGTANLLPADLESPRGEGLFAVVGGERLTVEPAGDFPLSGGGRLQLCIRPEAIQLLPESAGRPAGNVVRGRVKNFIFEGASLRYWIEALDQELVVDVFDPGEAGTREGEVWLRLDPRKIHLIREA